MPQTIFFLARLRPGVTPEEYEAWVERVDYPRVRTISAILEYRVMRITAGLEGEKPPFDYIERVVVTDVEAYQHERKSRADRPQFIEEIGRLIEPAHAFVTEVVGEPVE